MPVGISYLPLHEEAKKIAQEVGKVNVFKGEKLCQTDDAIEYIQNEVDKMLSQEILQKSLSNTILLLR